MLLLKCSTNLLKNNVFCSLLRNICIMAGNTLIGTILADLATTFGLFLVSGLPVSEKCIKACKSLHLILQIVLCKKLSPQLALIVELIYTAIATILCLEKQ